MLRPVRGFVWLHLIRPVAGLLRRHSMAEAEEAAEREVAEPEVVADTAAELVAAVAPVAEEGRAVVAARVAGQERALAAGLAVAAALDRCLQGYHSAARR
jgi:hypothetical protein